MIRCAPRSALAQRRRPPWTAAIPATMARPRPRGPRPLRARRVRLAIESGSPGPSSQTAISSQPVGDRNLDLDPAPTVLDRVRDEIPGRLGQAQTLAAHDGARRPVGQLKLDSGRTGAGPPRLDRIGEQRVQIDEAGLDRCPGTPAPASARSSSARLARPSSASIARSRAADRLRPRPPRSRPRRAAASGPRSSWQARATASCAPRRRAGQACQRHGAAPP